MTSPADYPVSSSVLDGWHGCFRIAESCDGNLSLPMRAQAHLDGPRLLHDPERVPFDDIAATARISHWLPMALHHVVFAALEDSFRETRLLEGGRWPAFRALCERHAAMSWEELVAAARRSGSDDIADFVAGSLYGESGLEKALAEIACGSAPLRLVSDRSNPATAPGGLGLTGSPAP